MAKFPRESEWRRSLAEVCRCVRAVRGCAAREGIRVTTVLPYVMRTGSHRNALFKGRREREVARLAKTRKRIAQVESESRERALPLQ